METLIQLLTQYHYAGFFIALFLCGLGFPFPEDIIVALGGYLVYQRQMELLPTLIVLWAGAMSGDLVLYGLGRRFGPEILAHKRLTWFFTPHRITAINRYFHKYGNLTLFFARFLVGLRATIFLTAGAFRIPFRKVLLLNGSCALISVTLVSFLAYYFGEKIGWLMGWLRTIEHALLLVIPILVLIVGWKIYRHYRKSQGKPMLEDQELEPPP